MTKIEIPKVLILLILVTAGILASIISFSNIVDAQEVKIPQWVKTTTAFWAKGEISDTEYVNALEYLVKERYMVIPSSIQVAEGQEITKSIQDLQGRVDQLEKTSSKISTEAPKNYPDSDITELNQKINELSLIIIKLDEQIKQEVFNRELADLGTIMSLKTYVKTGTGPAGKVSVACDSGDIATGGGGRSWGGGLDYSIPNSESNYGKPTGWDIREYSKPLKNMEVYVICLDITP
ncbi:MAG: hypothetical protein ACT4NJ_05280 [Nitrosopumilaceae archaeon]